MPATTTYAISHRKRIKTVPGMRSDSTQADRFGNTESQRNTYTDRYEMIPACLFFGMTSHVC